MSEPHDVDPRRRATLLGLCATAAAASPLTQALAPLVLAGPPPGRGSGPSRAVVAVARRPGLMVSGTPDPAKLRDGLGAALARAAGERGPVEAMRSLFKPTDVVGIKVNCMGGRGISSRPETALQLAAWLQAAGLPPERIVIWERTGRELRDAGFALATSGPGPRVLGTDRDYETTVREWGPAASCFARPLVEQMTALISLGVVKDHGLAGASLGLKNWFGAVNNPNRLHEDGCQPFVPHLVASPPIRSRLRLTVLDGCTGQCHGGPARSPRWVWPYEGFLVSTDPVAVDAVGCDVLDERRREVGLRTLAEEGRAPRYVAESAKLGLGVADRARIEIPRV